MLQKTLALFAVLVTSVSFADEAVPPSILAQRIANLEARKIAKAILKVATGDSLAADASVTLRGASRIPPGSIILRTYAFIKEQAASASGNTLAFGDFGLQSLTRGPMTGQQIEAARVTISRHLKRKGKLWIRVFPHKPVTKKPAEVRMGQGKGPVEFYVAVIKPGAVLFELAGVPLTIAREAFRLADAKLPFHCRFIQREGSAA